MKTAIIKNKRRRQKKIVCKGFISTRDILSLLKKRGEILISIDGDHVVVYADGMGAAAPITQKGIEEAFINTKRLR